MLDWVAKQNAWISEKASVDDLNLLLAELHPIVSQYTLQDIERLSYSKKGRTHKMLLAAKSNDLDQFSHFAQVGRKTKLAPPKPAKQSPQHEARGDLEDVYFALMAIKKRLDRLECMMTTVTEPESAAAQEAVRLTFFERLKRRVKR